MKLSKTAMMSSLLGLGALGADWDAKTKLPKAWRDDFLAEFTPSDFRSNANPLVAAYRDGRKVRHIARDFEISRQRVITLLKNAGVWIGTKN